MPELAPQPTCRLSGEPLDGAAVLLDVPDCPLPGIYPATAAESANLRVPLRVVQARDSGFVQLAHRFDDGLYADYGFAADTSSAYRAHLEWFADEIARTFPASTSVLEVGCGDGTLLSLLDRRGFRKRLGVDPGRAAQAAASERSDIVHGYFPADLPAAARQKRYGVIVLRHVLEHIEEPVAFVAALAQRLAPGGELWIEVPDLDAAVDAGLWSNFYPLHCNYFSAPTLDAVAAHSDLACREGGLVDVFGGSLLRRYRATGAVHARIADRVGDVAGRFAGFQAGLRRLAETAPAGTAGYGAAERTALTLGAAPELARRLTCLYDGNALLHGRHLAGTELEIRDRDALLRDAPPALVLFALSHRREILAGWRATLPGETLVAIADGASDWRRLDES